MRKEDLGMICFDVYYKDEKTGRIELGGLYLVKKECYLEETREFPLIYFPFYYMKNGMQTYEYLKGRVIDPNKANLQMLLDKEGIPEYNFMVLLKRFHGVDIDDSTWFKFDD